MSEAMLAKAVRQAAQSLSIAIFCAAITHAIVLPVVIAIVARAAIKMQAEEMRQKFEESRDAR
jgi:multisubunit Na+/H+ antiporter MnhG subunit